MANFPALLDTGGPLTQRFAFQQELRDYLPVDAPILRHLNRVGLVGGELGVQLRSLPAVDGSEGTVTVTSSDGRSDVWIGFVGPNSAVHFGSVSGFIAESGWQVGTDNWGSWLIVKAESATTGGRLVLRQPTGGGEDWHHRPDATDWLLTYQTDDDDSATTLIRAESDTGDIVLDQGVLALKEQTTPSAVADYGRIYTKTDNQFYFQDGAGVESAVALGGAPAADFVSASETETSTSYDDMTTAGPAVSVVTGTKAIVFIAAEMENSSGSVTTHMSVAVSGATTIAASDDWNLMHVVGTAAEVFARGRMITFGLGGAGGALTAGTNTFTAKYRVSSGTGTFDNRELLVIPL